MIFIVALRHGISRDSKFKIVTERALRKATGEFLFDDMSSRKGRWPLSIRVAIGEFLFDGMSSPKGRWTKLTKPFKH